MCVCVCVLGGERRSERANSAVFLLEESYNALVLKGRADDDTSSNNNNKHSSTRPQNTIAHCDSCKDLSKTTALLTWGREGGHM